MNPEIDELERLSQDLLATRFQLHKGRASVRLRLEFGLIRRHGHADAFLTAFKLNGFLAENRIPAKLIGAGPSSIWAFVHGLSEVNPMRHKLPAERFLIAGYDRSVIFSIVVDETRIKEVNDFIANLPSGKESVSVYPETVLEMVPVRTVEVIQQRRNPEFCLGAIPLIDAKTSAELRSGHASSIFQLESDEIREALPRLKSHGIEQIAALSAARQADVVEPGLLEDFVKRAGSPVRTITTSPTIQKIVGETYGLALFQEQIMHILHKLAGIPLSKAYRFIKDAAKRRSVDSIRERFLNSSIGTTLSAGAAEDVIDDLEFAAVYASCKSHHLANAVTTWQATYLKAHFRHEFDEVIENTAVHGR